MIPGGVDMLAITTFLTRQLLTNFTHERLCAQDGRNAQNDAALSLNPRSKATTGSILTKALLFAFLGHTVESFIGVISGEEKVLHVYLWCTHNFK